MTTYTTPVAERQEARIDVMLAAELLEKQARVMYRLARQAREAALRANQAETGNAA